jgi:hypothetical protein
MIKYHIFSLAVPARENMWHFIMFRENIFHISLKQKNILLIQLKKYTFHGYFVEKILKQNGFLTKVISLYVLYVNILIKSVQNWFDP